MQYVIFCRCLLRQCRKGERTEEIRRYCEITLLNAQFTLKSWDR